MFAALCLSAVVLAQVQRQGDDLLIEMHTEGCRPVSLATVSPGLWGTTSALDIAKAVETWQFHNLEAAGEPVALCAGWRSSDSGAGRRSSPG